MLLLVGHAASAESAGPGDPFPFALAGGSSFPVVLIGGNCNEPGYEAWEAAVAAGGATILASYSPGGPVIATIPLPAQLEPPPGLTPDEAGTYQWCPSYTVIGPPPGTYWITMVVGLVNFSNGPASVWKQLIVGDRCSGPPPVPSLMATVAPGTSTVTLQGLVGPGCSYDAFVVEAGSSPGSSDVTVFNLPGSLNFSATAVPSGVYYLRALTVNAFGASVRSREVPVSVPGGCTVLPTAPVNVAASVGFGGNVSLTWTNSVLTGRTFVQLDVLRLHEPPVNGVTATRVATPILAPTATTAVVTLTSGTYGIGVIGGGPCGTSLAPSGSIVVTVP
jgi:hypothetical protein